VTTPLHCRAGCTLPRQHLPSCGKPCSCSCHNGGAGVYPCDVPGGCHPNHRPAASCPGCVPAPAERGLLCLASTALLAHALTLAPDLIAHVRAHVPPGGPRGSRRAGDPPPPRVGSAVAAPVPLSLSAVDAADRLYAQLVSWTETAADDLGLTGPDAPRSWRTSASNGQAAGLPAGSDGTQATVYARWLHTHLDQIVARPWVTELLPDPAGDPDPDRPPLVTLVRWTERSWPLEEHPRWLATPCRECGLRTVRYYAPRDVGLPITISCRSCGYALPEELWDFEARKILDEREAAERARAPYQPAGPR